jgi:cytokinin dehydrogenase
MQALPTSKALTRRSLVVGSTALGAAIIANRPYAAGNNFPRQLRDQLVDRLFTDDLSRSAAAADFGEIIHRPPIAVLKPRTTEEITELVDYANRRGIKVAMRGRGHSMFGQAQAKDGVVIDSSALNAVRLVNFRGSTTIEAEAGASWGQILDLAYDEKLTPVVNVDPVYLSVGGTISTGGFGGTSWRDGFQTDHVLELQVVTGEGKLVTCSVERNTDLFNAALGGLGQCGLIVKAVIELMSAPTHVRLFVLSYPDLEAITADMMTILKDGRFDHVDGRTTPRKDGGFTYNLEGGAFHNAPEVPSDSQLLTGLRFESQVVRTMTYVEYHRRQPQVPSAPHPFLYLCLPASQFLKYAKRVFDTPAEFAHSSPRFSAWRKSSIKRPLTRLPDEDWLVRFQCSRNLPSQADVPAAIAMNRSLYERARDVGGTRLTTTAIPFSDADWRYHYGPTWKNFSDWKLRFDPNNVLTPGPGIFSS